MESKREQRPASPYAVAGILLIAAAVLGFLFQPSRTLTTQTGFVERALFPIESNTPVRWKSTSIVMSAGASTVRLVSQGSLFTSQDNGLTWAEVEGAAVGSARAVGQSLAGNHIVVVGADGVAAISTNNGASWSEGASGTRDDITTVAMAPLDSMIGLATLWNPDLGMLWTRDGGRTWTTIPIPAMSVSLATDGMLGLALLKPKGTQDRVIRTTDGGATWQTITGLPFMRSVALSANGKRAVALDFDRAVFTSDDGGATWRAQPRSVLATGIESLAISTNGEHVFAISGGVGPSAVSPDGGVTWTSIPNITGLSTAAISNDGRVVVAAGIGRLLSSIDGGKTWRHSTKASRGIAWWTIAATLIGLSLLGVAAARARYGGDGTPALRRRQAKDWAPWLVDPAWKASFSAITAGLPGAVRQAAIVGAPSDGLSAMRHPAQDAAYRSVRWKKSIMSARNTSAWSPWLPMVAPFTPYPAFSA